MFSIIIRGRNIIHANISEAMRHEDQLQYEMKAVDRDSAHRLAQALMRQAGHPRSTVLMSGAVLPSGVTGLALAAGFDEIIILPDNEMDEIHLLEDILDQL